MNIIQSPSPNFDGRSGYKPELIVVHCTDGFFPSDLEYLRNPNPDSPVGPVSAHYVVSPAGAVHQLVQESSRAWHAGRVDNPSAKLLKKNPVTGAFINPNYYSVGIETSLKLPGITPAVQYQALKELIKDIAVRNSIPIDRDHIVGHHEIFNPKTCPGTISVDQIVSELSAPIPTPQPPAQTNAQLKAQIIDLVNKIQ